MIRPCDPEREFDQMLAIVNDAAQAYRGVIPDDCWTEPYMPANKLRDEIKHGVSFWGWTDEKNRLQGVMGMQRVQDVTLIRHAYVRTEVRNSGIGGQLLRHLLTLAASPVLVGAWADAEWAIRFYEKHGFELVHAAEEKDSLLVRYWNCTPRQNETSVVLRRGQLMVR